MRFFKYAVALGLSLLGPGLPVTRAALFGLLPDFWGDAIVATDMTPEGRKLTAPTAGNPVYYLGRSLGARLGSIGGDQEPDTKGLNQFAAKILAQQGYLAARPGVDEPTLFLVVQWGYIAPDSNDLAWFLGYNSNQDVAATFGQLANFRSREVEAVVQVARHPIYAIIVTAFEFKSARTPHPVIYWQTRIGLPANGKSMEEALPTMLVAAGPAIGRESEKPMLRDTDNAREGSVKLGELKVLDVLETPVDTADGKK